VAHIDDQRTTSDADTRNEGRQVQRKQFFFEKKNQKTFALWLTRQARVAGTKENKSFLVLFFKKELLVSRLLSLRA